MKEGLERNCFFGVLYSSCSVSFSDIGWFIKFEVKNSENIEFFDLILDDDDIVEFECFEFNYKEVRGENRGVLYEEGDMFRLIVYMFWYMLVYFVIVNKLGEFDDIRY